MCRERKCFEMEINNNNIDFTDEISFVILNNKKVMEWLGEKDQLYGQWSSKYIEKRQREQHNFDGEI